MTNANDSMIKYIDNKHKKHEVLKDFNIAISEWFDEKFEELTPPQSYAVPIIKRKENVLVSSPTGSGKTLTAFLSIINDLYEKHENGGLEDGIHAIYISPLKALANDINRNLKDPLAEIEELAANRNYDVPKIQVGVRSGDTTVSERAKMSRKPPHILITTPESLGLLISSTKFKEHMRKLRYIIIDEIHDIANNKRGTHLSLSIERLNALIEKEPTRIGLSATQAPIETIANFLGGYEQRKPRPVNIVDIKERKKLDLKVISPVDDLTEVSAEVVRKKMYDRLAELVKEHRTTLIFTNTRAATESVGLELKQRDLERVAAHHGSLSKEIRLEVEQELKEGKMDAVVTSTSLELGIDIGFVDLVVQIGSPKSIAKGLQRIGRAGHAIRQISKGRLLVCDPDDLIECAVLVKSAHDGIIDRVSIPECPKDVLAQCIVGMSLEKEWNINEAFEVIKGSYPYRNIEREEYMEIIDFLGSERMSEHGIYPKIWLDIEENTFGVKRGARQIYNMNIGTIPQEINYRVVLEGRGTNIGNLSEKFVEKLNRNDIFVLGGRTYQYIQTEGTRVNVKDGLGRKPTIPSWSGETLPRSFDLSEAVGQFRGEISNKIEEGGDMKKEGDTELEKWLSEKYRLDVGSSKTIISHLREQKRMCKFIPSNKKLMLEGYIDNRNRKCIIFHFPFGRRVNEAISHAIAYELGRKMESNIGVTMNDDSFMLTMPKGIEIKEVEKLVKNCELETTVRRSINKSEIFAQRFRHCANRSFMVLKNYKGREISLPRQQLRTSQVLEALNEIETFPILDETYREIMYDAFDLKNAQNIIVELKNGEREIEIRDYSITPTPFAHGVILAGLTDIVLMEDRSALLRELHDMVLQKVVEKDGKAKARFDKNMVESYFNEKKPSIIDEKSLVEAIKACGGIELFGSGENLVYKISEIKPTEIKEICEKAIDGGILESVWTGKKEITFTTPENVSKYRTVYAKTKKINKEIKKNLQKIKDGKKRIKKEIISELESAYLIKRLSDGTPIYRELPVERSYEKSLDWLLKMTIGNKGPMTMEEMSVLLNIPEKIVEQSLFELEERGTIQGGDFTLGNQKTQYLLAEDIIYLEAQTNSDLEVVTERNLRMYLDEKMFKKYDNIREFFNDYGEISSARYAYYRLKSGTLEEWWDLIENGQLLQGRFRAGKLSYCPINKIGMYQKLYKREVRGTIQNDILELMNYSKPLTKTEIAKRLETSTEKIEPALRDLEESLQIQRYIKERNRSLWTTQNKYTILPEYDSDENAAEEIVLQVIGALGPLPLLEIKRETGLPLTSLKNIIENKQNEGVVSKIVVASSTRQFMYTMSKEIAKIKKEKKKIATRILGWRDPYMIHVKKEAYAKYGEEWTHPIIRGGDLIGYLEAWPMSGLLDIREVVLDDWEILEEVIQAIEEHAGYLKEFHNDLIRIKIIDGKEIEEVPTKILNILIENGYSKIRNWLVSGPIVDVEFSEDEVNGYLLWNQHIHPENRFKTAKEVFSKFGGVRSEFELSLRVSGKWSHPKDYSDEMEIVRGNMIPAYSTYCTLEDAMIYRDARDISKEDGDEIIITHANSKDGLPKDELMKRSGLDPVTFKSRIDRLYRSLHIVRTPRGYYRALPTEKIMDREEARYFIVRRIVENYGMVSAENLGHVLKGEMPMSEIRSILYRLVKEEELTKGFMWKDNEMLVWCIKKDLEKIKGKDFKGSFILHATDRLSQYLSENIKQKYGLGTCHSVFNGSKCTGVFKVQRSGKEMTVTHFIGERHERYVIEAWARQLHFGLEWNLKHEESVEIN